MLSTLRSRMGAVAVLAALAVGSGACALSGGGPATGPDTLSKIKKAGVLVAGTKYDAVVWGSVPQGEDRPEGFDIDVGNELARRMGVRLETRPVTSANRIANLQTNKIDIVLASMVHTRERDKTIDFSIDYFKEDQRLLVLADSPYRKIADLAHKKIVVAQGSIQETLVPKVCATCSVLSVAKWTDTMQALKAHQADAILATDGTIRGSAKTLEASGTHTRLVGPDGLLPLPYGIGVRQGDANLRDTLNLELMAMQSDGTYARLVKKWWGNHPFAIETWPEK